MMNTKGFATIGLIITFPLIAGFAYWGVKQLWLINQKNAIQNLCSEKLLLAQKELITGNNQILKLNKQALSLSKKKKRLKKLRAAAPPKAKVVLQIAITAIVAKQLLLRTKQNQIFYSFEMKSRRHLQEMQRQFHAKLNEIKFSRIKSPTGSIQLSSTSSKLKKKSFDTAPTYKRTYNHARKQSLTASWRVNVASLLPKNFAFSSNPQQAWVGECSSHPKKGGLKWYPAIGKGKALLKLF